MSRREPPSAWTEAAREVCRFNPTEWQSDLLRILGDSRVAAILPEIDALIGARAGKTRSGLLFQIASGGGWQPPETEAARAKRRRKIAALARELAATMDTDVGFDHFRLPDLWAFAAGAAPQDVNVYHGRPKTMPAIDAREVFKWTRAPTVGAALLALAGAIDRDLAHGDAPLHWLDRRPAWNPLAAQPGRAEARQALLERALCQWFEFDGALRYELTATLVEVALKLDTVDPEDLARRWRKFRDKV